MAQDDKATVDESKDVVDETVDDNTDDKNAADDNKPQDDTEVETLARSLKWVPEDEHKGNNKWVNAHDYIENLGEISKKQTITARRHESDMREIKSGLKQSLKFQKETFEKETDRLREELQVAKDAAVTEADVDEVRRIDKKIEELDEHVADAQDNDDSPAPEFVAWKEKNPWYGGTSEEDQFLTDYAHTIDERYPHLSLEQVYSKIDEGVTKLRGMSGDSTPAPPPQKKQVNAVAGGGRSGSKKAKTSFSANDLTFKQRTTAQTMVDTGVFETIQEYADALFEESGGK